LAVNVDTNLKCEDSDTKVKRQRGDASDGRSVRDRRQVSETVEQRGYQSNHHQHVG